MNVKLVILRQLTRICSNLSNLTGQVRSKERLACLGHNLFLVSQFCDADLEVAFRRNTCFIRDLDGVDLLKGDRSTNLYTINLYDMASASPICLMARATPAKSWLWHQQLSHLNFDTINDLAKNDLVSGLSKFKYAKEHLCYSCEQGKSKRASHPPKHVSNSKQRLHLLHMDLCGPMRVTSINVDPPKRTLVLRVQLAATTDDEMAKRYGYLALNLSSRSQSPAQSPVQSADFLQLQSISLEIYISVHTEPQKPRWGFDPGITPILRPGIIESTNRSMGKKKKRKGKSKSTNGAQFAGPSVKQNVRYEPKAATSVPKKGVSNVGNSSKLRNIGTSFNKDNMTSPNSFSALNIDEGEEKEEE
nr:retrovirus-related Pol polyprotein from transposon TNT 1-94 [Tanacetum cinerariifolium]